MPTVLVAVDLSPRSAAVVESASALAAHMGARILLVHVVTPTPGPSVSVGDITSQTITDRLRVLAEQELEVLAKAIAPNVATERRVLTGYPWQTVCKLAESESADLVVIGAHGYSQLDRMLGTTAARVVNHVDRPVLVVRSAEVKTA